MKTVPTILVVDDDADVCLVVARMLEKRGYHVLQALSGEAALGVARRTQKPIDLVLADVLLPGMSGYETCERFHLVHPATKVLFMTGYPGNVLDFTELAARHIGCLPKPFTIDELAAKVREVLALPYDPEHAHQAAA